jgi:hypothetical protein
MMAGESPSKMKGKLYTSYSRRFVPAPSGLVASRLAPVCHHHFDSIASPLTMKLHGQRLYMTGSKF